MCGFVVHVALHSGPPDVARLGRATDLLAHRGPDDAGRFIEGGIGIGFRRLSIFDLSTAGHQPMASSDGRFVVAFNGAIFNFVELRGELQALGHQFRSSSDTEVLLAAYREWGSDCLDRFNGMWAFVIYDRLEKRIFGSRDRFGIKPLFWYADDDSLIFASEIKAIRDSGLARLEFNEQVLAEFLLEGTLDHSEDTFYRRVSQVPAGTAFETNLNGRLVWHRYWSVLDAAQALPVPSDPPAAFAELFEDAVRLRMRSDVPVGVLLSGGLDSSSILCSMGRQLSPATREGEFGALCYMDPHFDETPFIDATLAQTRASLWRLDVDPAGFWDTFARVIWHQDEPVHSINSVVGFHLMKLARAHDVKVVLNGQGADETLAGYSSYFTSYWIELLRSGRLLALEQSLRAVAQARGGRSNVLSEVFGMLLGQARQKVPGYPALARRRRRARLERKSWASDDVKRLWTQRDQPAAPDLAAALHYSLERSHLPVYLRVEDRNSMAHGVEQRLPFLDHRLVALAFRLGPEWKLRGDRTKVILREAMRGRIPEVVRTRTQKFGFPTSVDSWFRGPLYGRLRDMLSSRTVRESGLWDLGAVERALDQHRRGDANVGERLFDVVQVCLWLQLSEWQGDAARERGQLRA